MTPSEIRIGSNLRTASLITRLGPRSHSQPQHRNGEGRSEEPGLWSLAIAFLGACYAVANDRSCGLADVLAGHVVDVHHIVLIARAVTHQGHGPLACVFELVERAASNQRGDAGCEHGRAAVGKAHGTFALKAGEN